MTQKIKYDSRQMRDCCGILHVGDFRLDTNFVDLDGPPLDAAAYKALDAELVASAKVTRHTRILLTAVIPDRIKDNRNACAEIGAERVAHDVFSVYNIRKYAEGWLQSRPFVNKKSGNAVVILYKDIV